MHDIRTQNKPSTYVWNSLRLVLLGIEVAYVVALVVAPSVLVFMAAAWVLGR
jgi:hypothetical protein